MYDPIGIEVFAYTHDLGARFLASMLRREPSI